MNNRIRRILIVSALFLHTMVYKLVTWTVTKVSGGMHPKHRVMGYHQFFVDNVRKDDSVLDVGCGNGALTLDVARKARRVVGIDNNRTAIESARKRFSAPNIEYIVGDATRDLADGRFDVVILSSVLEHIDDRRAFLKALAAKTPTMLIRVPMINRDWITLYKKEMGVEWRLNRQHAIEYTAESFKEEIEAAGLKLQEYSIQFGEIWAVVTAA